MSDLGIWKTPLDGVLLIEPHVFTDERGFFLESFNEEKYYDGGVKVEFIQDNHSKSDKGVLRGLHYQKANPQDKLVRVTQGEVFDVAVDMREESPTYGCWVGYILSDQNMLQLFVPKGFAHGFYVMSKTAEFMYKCSGPYDPDDEGGIIWDDPDLKINWPISDPPLLKKKDEELLRFRDIFGKPPTNNNCPKLNA